MALFALRHMDSDRDITLGELFRGFLKIGLLGFGGVAPIARHVIVEDRAWLTEKEYATVLGMGKVLPGANVVNAAVMIGDRFRGRLGALACVLGVMLMPLVVLMAVATVYARYADSPGVNAALAGAGAAVAGMVMGTGLKMARNLRPSRTALLIGALAIVLIGVLSLPLVPVVVALAPLALLLTWLAGRRKAAR